MDLSPILEAIPHMNGPELERVRQALERLRDRLAQSAVIERRGFGSGILQLEYRTNPKTGTQRGPTWYFHRREEDSVPCMLAGLMIQREPKLRGSLKDHPLYTDKTSPNPPFSG